MCSDQLLEAAKRTTVEFLRNLIGAGEVRVHYANQSHRLAVPCKLVINTRVIAPKCTHTDDCNGDWSFVRQKILLSFREEALSITQKTEVSMSGER
jgi:hypothetical protein